MKPAHIAIIMDGNGRWAQRRGLPRIFGHREGARTVKKIVTACSNRGIQALTIYGFSKENWNRPEREKDLLFKLMKVYAGIARKLCMENKVRFKMIGDVARLPAFLRGALESLEKLTARNEGLILQAALSYGGRDEIIRAVNRWAKERAQDRLLTEEEFSTYLDTTGVPDPDLIIRTSGEFRTSNFLLWQSAYAEYYFTELTWPEFSEVELDKAMEAFGRRQRRFGGVENSRLETGL